MVVMIATKVDALGVKPFLNDIVMEAGSVHEFTIEVSNQESFIELITFRAQAFEAGNIEGVPEFINNENALPVRWFKVPSNEIVLEPGETKLIPISITTPPDAQPGGYYAAVFAKTRPAENATIGNSNEVGVLHFITIEGEMRTTREISEFNAQPKTIVGFPVELSFSMNNTGSIHTTPQGIISITNLFTKTKHVVTVNDDLNKVLPRSHRTITQYWKENSKWYETLNPFAIGLYEAELQLNGFSESEGASSRFIIYTPLLWVMLLLGAGWVIIRKIRL